MKYQLSPVHVPAQTEYTWEDILQAKTDLQIAYENLGQTERQLREIDDLMFNAVRSLDLLSKFGSDMIPQLNLDGGLEALCRVQESLITVEKATEGLVDSVKEGIKKFIAWVKELFTKIHIWIKNFVNKLRTSWPALSDPLSAKLKKQGGHDAELKSASAGIIGPKLIQNVVQLSTQMKSCRNAVRTMIDSKTEEDLKSIIPAAFFDSCTAASIIDGHLFKIDQEMSDDVMQKYLKPRSYSNGNDLNPWMDEADAKAGITMSDLVSLETAQKDIATALVEFEGEASVRLSSLVARLEKLDKAGDEYNLLRKVVLGLTNANKANANFVAAVIGNTSQLIKKIESKMNGDGTEYSTKVDPKIYRAYCDYVEKTYMPKLRDYVTKAKDENGNTKEWVRPAFTAQDALDDLGINPVDVTRAQTQWIIAHKGNPKKIPQMREVERICMEIIKSSSEQDADGLPKDFVEAVVNHDRTKIVASIVFYLGELEEGTMNDMDLPLKAFNAASKEFKAANIELEQDDNGEWLQSLGGIPEDPAQWNSDHFGKVKNLLRHRFCKRYLDLAMKVLRYLKNNNGQNRPAPVDTSDKIKARVAIIRQIDKDEKNPKNQWAYKLALEADKAFKSKGVNDFFEEDDGLVYNKVIEIKAALRTNFSAVKIKRAMSLIESGSNGSGNIGLRIKAKVEEFIKNNDKEGLKLFIINDLLSRPETYRFALKAADLAQKSFSDGFYHEPEVAIDASDTADTLKKKLKMFFTRGILSRIVSILSSSGT